MRRGILIVSASMGAGHDGAAYELQRRLEAQGHDVRVVDYLKLIPWGLGSFMRWTYLFQLQRLPWTYDLTYAAFNRGTGRLDMGAHRSPRQPRDPPAVAPRARAHPARRGGVHLPAGVARARSDAQEEAAARAGCDLPLRLRRASALGASRRRPAPRREPGVRRHRGQARESQQRGVGPARRRQVPHPPPRPRRHAPQPGHRAARTRRAGGRRLMGRGRRAVDR